MIGQGGAAVAVDVVVLALDSTEKPCLQALLGRREHAPFAGAWALPGGLVRHDEDLAGAVERVLSPALVQPPVRHLEQVATFARPDRDPRGRVVSVSYLGLMPRTGPTSGEAGWWPVADLPPLAFDHAAILLAALERLRSKLSYSNVAYGLLPDEFTLRELQDVYEAVLGREVDKRNFRKKVRALALVVEAAGMRRGPHRPAQLYRFSRPGLVLLDNLITA